MISWPFAARAEAAPTPTLELADDVVRASATDVTAVELDGRALPFAALATTPVTEGRHTVAFQVAPSEAARLVLPPCAGKVAPTVRLDGQPQSPTVTARGQLLSIPAGTHQVTLELAVSGYEKRVACGFAPRFGAVTWSEAGLRTLRYASARPKGSCTRCRPGQALVYVPRSVVVEKSRGFANGKPPLLLGLHPWNGALETYAAYTDLLDAAEAEGVVLLFADGLGNSLYTETAEAEVVAALDALIAAFPIDPARVSIFGASMGGAGATTVGFHRPDRFASITSLFGDSKYDLSSYVRTLIPDEAAAKRVNALDMIDNVRNVPVFLIHGDADKSSKIEQSIWLEQALGARGFAVRLDRKPGRGHEGTLVSEYAKEMVQRAAHSTRATPSRISYRSFRAVDRGAYGLDFDKRSADGEAFVDVEKIGNVIQVHRADGVRAVRLAPGTFGSKNLPIHRDAAVDPAVPITWITP